MTGPAQGPTTGDAARPGDTVRITRPGGTASGPTTGDPGRPARPSLPPPPGAPQRRSPRPTEILPTTPDGADRDLADPIDVVKAALDGTPLSKPRRPGDGPPADGDSGAAAAAVEHGEAPPLLPRRGPARGPRDGRPPRGAGVVPPGFKLPAFKINWKWVRRGTAALVALVVLLPLITFGMAYAIVDVPKPGDIRTAQISTILASDGSEIAKIIPPEGNRIDISIDQVPQHVRAAVMAAEDRDFYSNPGFSFSGFARAFKNNLVGGDTQGGSTITQQYVKNALVGDARSGTRGLIRKAKELVISTKMSREWSKDQVMEAYLNIIYFGRGAYGISAASQAYFAKPVNELTVSEGALLAALIQRPSTLDPAVDHAGAMERWNWVLDGMVTAFDGRSDWYPESFTAAPVLAWSVFADPTFQWVQVEVSALRMPMLVAPLESAATSTPIFVVTVSVPPPADLATSLTFTPVRVVTVFVPPVPALTTPVISTPVSVDVTSVPPLPV